MELEHDWRRAEESAAGWPKFWRLLLAGVALFFFSACAKEVATLAPADLPASLVVKRIEQRRDRFVSLRAAGTLRLESRRRRWSGRAFLLGRTPQSFRLEVVGFLGEPLLYVASNGKLFLTWVPGRKHAYQGSTSGKTLSLLTDLPLTDRDALLLLAGIAPPLDHGEASLFIERKSKDLMLLLEDEIAEEVERVWLEAEDFNITRIQMHFGSGPQLEARFEDFVAIQGVAYPKRVVIEGAGARLSLHYEQLALNDSLERNDFHLILPEGVEILPY